MRIKDSDDYPEWHRCECLLNNDLKAPAIEAAMHRMMIASLLLFLFVAPAQADQSVTLYLNWKPGPEHVPLFYAEKGGLYEQEGVHVNIEPGTGSGNTLRVVAKDPASMGVADFQAVLATRSKGIDVIAVMKLLSNSPDTFYWLKSSGIRSIHDFSGKRIGAEERDSARLLWRALAKGKGIDPQSVIWVNVSNNAKVDALRSGAIDIAVNAFPDSFRFYGLVVPYRQHGIVRGDCSHRRPVCRRPGSAGVHGDR